MNICKNLSNSTISSALLAIGAVAGIAATPASAITFSLGELISSQQSFIVGDKMFSNFSCVKAGIGTPNVCDDINVNTLDDLDYGIQFQADFSAIAPNTVDFLLGFDVMVLDPDFWINDVELSFDSSTTGNGLTNVTETVINLDPSKGPIGAPLAQIGVFVSENGQVLKDEAFLEFNTKKLRVAKDVILSGGTNGTASILTIDQRFSQKRENVPEPASTLGLLAFGFLGIALKRKKA